MEGQGTAQRRDLLVCPMCGFKGKTAEALRYHRKIHQKRKYYCSKCEYESYNRRNVQIHEPVHLEGHKLYSCKYPDCDFATKISYDFKIHKRQHKNYHHKGKQLDKPYTCGLCKAQFQRSSRLEAHCRIHTGEKPFASKLFNYSISTSSSLIPHIKVDESNPEKKFGCPLCQFKSKWPNSVMKHWNVHVNSESVKNGNHETENSSSEPGDHDRSSSERENQPSTDETQDFSKEVAVGTRVVITSSRRVLKKYSCEFCYRSFTKEISLLNHLRQHAELQLYRCTKCTFRTTVERLFRYHQNKHNLNMKKALLSCKLCGTNFGKEESLVLHMSLLHKNPYVLLKRLKE